MRRCLRRLLLLLVCVPAFAATPPAETPSPSSELTRLEQGLVRAQDAKSQGRLAPKDYDAFLAQFRPALDKAWSRSPRTPPETASYARIQAKLGDAAQARIVLREALKHDPDSADLHLGVGDLALARKDYAAALSEAKAVLARDPGDRRALSLWAFSEGRGEGTADLGAVPAAESPAPSASPANGTPASVPRAYDRDKALRLSAQAVARLKVNDQADALRLLALAEASDPTLADVPMQQGLAYTGLKRLGQAYERYATAEKMFAGHDDALAKAAREFKEDTARLMAEADKPVGQEPSPAPNGRRTTWPLSGAVTGALLMAAISMFGRSDETRGRRALMSAMMVGVGASAGAFLGLGAYTLLAGEGGSLALAGGGTVGAAAQSGTTLSAIGGGLVGGAAGAKASERANASEASPQSGGGQGPGPMPLPMPMPNSGEVRERSGDYSSRAGGHVLDRFVDGTRLSSGFLRAHENAGGHTVRYHVEKPLSFLLERLKGIEDASSFNDMRTAEAEIRETVLANIDGIESWSAGPLAELRLSRIGDKRLNVVGYAVSAGNPKPIPKYDTRVVLRRNEKCSILILTAFPE